MNTESLKTLIDSFQNDEAQIIVLLGLQLALIGAMTGIFLSDSMKNRSIKWATAISGTIVYLIILKYSAFLAKRLDAIRNSLSGVNLSHADLPLKDYVNAILSNDWYYLPPLGYVIISLVFYIPFFTAFLSQFKFTKLPKIH